MDYSLIVGIHDSSLDDMHEHNAFPIPHEEEEEEDEAEDPVEEGGEEEEEENGMDEEEEGALTPPDSPQPHTSLPAFCGELDGELERFGVYCTAGMLKFIGRYASLPFCCFRLEGICSKFAV